ncbi:Proliferation-associated protein 2G4 [Entophlyctis sp. JEL0112]|nr:Proliferation-associated protein 2G4 [Entophlyctis sp. JEL0112]
MSHLARKLQASAMAIDGAPTTASDSLADPAVMQKYQLAASIANDALRAVLTACVPGARVSALCRLGDEAVARAAQAVFSRPGKTTQQPVERGCAFPTCVCVNAVVANHAPADAPADADDGGVLAAGDVVKVELGAHVDGFIATSAHTLVVVADTAAAEVATAPARGRVADVVCAAYLACEAAVRLVRAGADARRVFETINTIAQAFDVRPVEGTASHQIKRFLLEAETAIVNSVDPENAPDFIFGTGEVYSINILMTSGGTGACQESSTLRTTVHQRDVSVVCAFKLKSSRAAFNALTQSYNVFPFALQRLADGGPAFKIGLAELVRSGVLAPRPVFVAADPNAFVAQFKATVAVAPGSGTPLRLTAAFNPPYVHSDRSINDAGIEALLKQDIKIAKASRASGAEVSAGTEMDES